MTDNHDNIFKIDESDDDSFDYVLKNNFEYGVKGETDTAKFIRLTAPSSKQLKYCTELKQNFFRAMHEFADGKEKEKDEGDIKGSDIINLLYMSTRVDMMVVLANAIELFNTGVAQVDGETKLTKPLMELMSADDLEGMTGEYLANFILLSVLKDAKLNT